MFPVGADLLEIELFSKLSDMAVAFLSNAISFAVLISIPMFLAAFISDFIISLLTNSLAWPVQSFTKAAVQAIVIQAVALFTFFWATGRAVEYLSGQIASIAVMHL
jgi:hypothetical protein